jgi:hypothetical protein
MYGEKLVKKWSNFHIQEIYIFIITKPFFCNYNKGLSAFFIGFWPNNETYEFQRDKK